MTAPPAFGHSKSVHVQLGLRIVTRVLAELREKRKPFYSETGRPSIDPELMLRMLIVGYCYGIRFERKLCEEVELHLAYRWFCCPPGEATWILSGTTLLPHQEARMTSGLRRSHHAVKRYGLWRPSVFSIRETRPRAPGDLDEFPDPADATDERIVI
jgi:hypothetical protein